MRPEPLDPNQWRARCAHRITVLDDQITGSEAQTVAEDVYAFERTRAMEPEDAADFVAEAMGRTVPPRFERRSPNRLARAPIVTSILRFLRGPWPA